MSCYIIIILLIYDIIVLLLLHGLSYDINYRVWELARAIALVGTSDWQCRVRPPIC